MKRRKFLDAVGGAATSWPLVARAQQAKKLPTIGVLGTATSAGWSSWVAAFAERLRELGWVEGRTVAIEYRWAEGSNDRAAAIAAEFVQRKVDLILTSGTAVREAKEATATIPIVFAVAVDPVGSGFVASLARPGGNVTGLSIQSHELAGKRLEMLRETLPGMRRLAVMANADYPAAMQELEEVRIAGGAMGLIVASAPIRRSEDIALAFETIRHRVDALLVVGDSLVNTNRLRIGTFALGARVPMISAFREIAEAGGLISYGASYPDMFRRAAEYVDMILRGAKAADIPVEQPTKFDLVINLVAAKALGLVIPPTLLARANEVIE
jgi:putative ABC transport system substrate-binding protein